MAGKKGVYIPVSLPSGPNNGCVRLLMLYVISLLLVICAALGLSSNVLANLPIVRGLLGTTSSAVITSSGGVVVTNPPSSSTGGGPIVVSGGVIAVNSIVAASPQGGTLASWSSPPFYIVQPGDTLAGIATQYGTTPDALKQYNPGLTDSIYVNQVIFLPPVGGGPLPDTGRNANP